MKNKTVKGNYFLSLIRYGCGSIFLLINFAYVSRVLSPDGLGKVDFARSVVSCFTYFATLGVSTYGIREVARVRDKKIERSQVVKEIFIINLISTLIAYILFFCVIYMVKRFMEYKDILLICGISIGFTALGLDWLYNAIEEFRYITLRQVAFQVISLIFIFSFVKDSTDYNVYALILTFATVGSNALNFIHARRYISIHTKKKLSLKKHLGPIFIFFSNSIAGNIYQILDTSMVGFLSNDRAVGLYSASVKMNRVLVGVLNVLPTVLLPRVSYYLKNGEIDKYKTILKKSFNYLLVIALPLTVLLVIMSDEVLIIFSGKKFLPASLCTKVLACLVIFIPVSSFAVNQILIPFGKEKQQFFTTFFGAIADLLLNIVLIPHYEQLGAAIGTAVTAGCIAILSLFMCMKCIDLRFLFIGMGKYFFGTIIFGLVTGVFYHIIDGFFKYIIPPIVGISVYFVILVLLKDEITREVILMCKNAIRKVIIGFFGR